MRLTQWRSWRRALILVFLGVALLIFLSSRRSNDRLERLKARYTPDRLTSLSEEGSIWLPGGRRATLAQIETLVGSGAPPPMKALVSSQSRGLDLIFPHIADGVNEANNIRIETSIILVGTGSRDAQVTIQFFGEGGNPLEVSIGGFKSTSFEYEVRRGQTLRLRTEANGPIQSGWARVHSSQPVGATLTFSITDLRNRLNAEVGVDKSSLESETAVLVDVGPGYDTAVAFVNPDGTSSTQVELLLNSLDGVEQDRTTVTLGPGGKRALFVTELFGQLANSSFQGVLLLRSPTPLGVLTLRQRGRHLTTLPSVRRYAVLEEPIDLYLYRLGSGVEEPLAFQTSFVVINHSDQVANIVLDLFSQDGTPLTTSVGGEETSQILRAIPPFGAAFLTTSDEGPLKLGWGRLRSDQKVGASAVFQLFSRDSGGTSSTGLTQDLQGGTFLSEVGVEAVIPLNRFTVFADSISTRNTAIAVSNPDENSVRSVTYTLYRNDGGYVNSIRKELEPQHHTAEFINEIFPEVEGIDEFEGRVEIRTSNGVGGTLRLAGTLLTSLPTMIELKGFKPTAEVEFHSELGNSSPSLTFKIFQFDNDMSLDRVEVEIPEVSFDSSPLQESESLVILGNTGASRADVTVAFGYVDSIEANGDAVISLQRLREDGDSTSLLEMGTLTLGSTAGGGFRAVLQFLYRTPNSYIPDDFYFQLFMPDGLVSLPAQGTTLQILAKLTSVSLSSRQDIRLVEDVSHEIELPVYPQGVPLILNARPFASRSQGPFAVRTSDLPENMENLQAFFTDSDQNPLAAQIVLREGNDLLIDVPEGTRTGPFWLETDGQPGNPFKFHMMFDPAPTTSVTESTEPDGLNLDARLSQRLGELQFVSWETRVTGAILILEGLEEGQLIGSGSYQRPFFTDEYELRVRSVEEGNLTLGLMVDETAAPNATFRISQPEENAALIEYLPEQDPLLPAVCTEDFTLQWATTTPLFRGVNGVITANAKVVSVRTGPGENTRFYHYATQESSLE